MTDPWEDIFWFRRWVSDCISHQPYYDLWALAVNMSLDDYFDTSDLIDL